MAKFHDKHSNGTPFVDSPMALTRGISPLLRCSVELPRRGRHPPRWRCAATAVAAAAQGVRALCSRSAVGRRCLRTSPRRSPVHILSACNEYLGDINNDVLLLYLINLSLNYISYLYPSLFLPFFLRLMVHAILSSPATFMQSSEVSTRDADSWKECCSAWLFLSTSWVGAAFLRCWCLGGCT